MELQRTDAEHQALIAGAVDAALGIEDPPAWSPPLGAAAVPIPQRSNPSEALRSTSALLAVAIEAMPPDDLLSTSIRGAQANLRIACERLEQLEAQGE